MSDAHTDDLLQELRAELEVTPSPEFAAKVRARVAETAAASWASRWAMWGGLAAMAAVVIAFATTSTIAPPAVSVPAIVTTAAAPPVVPERVPDLTASPVAGRPPVRKHAVAVPPRPASDVRRVTSPPVLEVITNQPALIRRAFEQAALQREFPINQPAMPGPIEPLTMTKVVIDPIVIPGGAEPPGGVSPVIRRVSAVDATRSPR